MTKKKYAIILTIIFFAASCSKDIVVDVGSNAPSQLVIYGYITNETKAHSIRISRSVGFSYTDSPVSGAIVKITDCDGIEFILDEDPEEPGIYLTADDVQGEEGKTYTLDVHIDGNGFTASATMPRMHNIEKVEFRVPEFHFDWFNENFMAVHVHIADEDNLPEENFYSVFVWHNDSALNSTIDRFLLGYGINGDMPIHYFRIETENGLPGDGYDDEDEIILQPDDVVKIQINAISRAYAIFISTAQTELSGSIPIFSGPPANVRSNIETIAGQSQALGFFTAFSGREASAVYE